MSGILIREMNLTHKKCAPCEGGVPPLTPEEILKYLPELEGGPARHASPARNDILSVWQGDAGGWEVLDNKKIKREFAFRNFKEAISFVNKVAEIAEREGRHPDMHIFYNRVVIELSTHAIKGLSENDFIMAAKIDTINL